MMLFLLSKCLLQFGNCRRRNAYLAGHTGLDPKILCHHLCYCTLLAEENPLPTPAPPSLLLWRFFSPQDQNSRGFTMLHCGCMLQDKKSHSVSFVLPTVFWIWLNCKRITHIHEQNSKMWLQTLSSFWGFCDFIIVQVINFKIKSAIQYTQFMKKPFKQLKC